MSAADRLRPQEPEHEYFRRLEDVFIRLRGAPLLLSPADWEVARGWRREGIPLELVVAVLEKIMSRRVERRGRSGVRSLKYFDEAVSEAWRQQVELGAAPRGPLSVPLDVAARLAALERSLPAIPEGLSTVRQQIRGLGADAASVEAQLAILDADMLERANQSLSRDQRTEIDGRVERAMQRLQGGIPEDEAAGIRNRLWRRHLRKELGLPVLSLFSPDATALSADEDRRSS